MLLPKQQEKTQKSPARKAISVYFGPDDVYPIFCIGCDNYVLG
jgi:hypothetical protein